MPLERAASIKYGTYDLPYMHNEIEVQFTDEPTGNLDKDTAQDIIHILKESAHQMNKCVIVVTHSNDLAKQAADEVFRLKRGILSKE